MQRGAIVVLHKYADHVASVRANMSIEAPEAESTPANIVCFSTIPMAGSLTNLAEHRLMRANDILASNAPHVFALEVLQGLRTPRLAKVQRQAIVSQY